MITQQPLLEAETTQEPGLIGVSEALEALQRLFKAGQFYAQFWIVGEVVQVKAYPSGLYFDLTEVSKTQRDYRKQPVTYTLSCFLPRGIQDRLGFEVQAKSCIRVQGEILMRPEGRLQFKVSNALPSDQAGAKAIRLKQLYQAFEAKGYFKPERKRPLPLFPRRMGIVTSASGAVIHDMFRVSRERYPAANLLLYSARVQGAQAGAELAQGVRFLSTYPGIDVIMVGRGGGSNQDLDPFNDPELIEAIYASRIPVVSAVGHQVDRSLCDLVADVTVATPSQAAEKIWPSADRLLDQLTAYRQAMIGTQTQRLQQLQYQLTHLRQALPVGLTARLNQQQHQLAHLSKQLQVYHPQARLQQQRQILEQLSRGLQAGLIPYQQACTALQTVASALKALNPKQVLNRGFALVSTLQGRVIPSLKTLKAGQTIQLEFQDGQATVVIEKLLPHPSEGEIR